MNRRPDWWIALGLLGLAVLLMMPYLLRSDAIMWPRSGLGTDLLTFNLPPLEYVRESLHEHEQIPLWQTTAMGGLPMIGNPAIRVFYPPQFLLTLLPIPALTVFALMNVLHLWLAGMGGYGLARLVMGISRPAAIFGAVGLMLTPRLFSNLAGDVGYTYGLCWVPLCLLCTWIAFERRSWHWALGAGASLAAIYLLNIQFILYMGWLVAACGLISAWQGWRESRQMRSLVEHAAIGTVIFAICFGLAAFQILPFITYLPYQSREAMTLADGNYLALPPPLLIHTIIPIPFKFPEWEIYAGLLPLLFAPFAAFHGKRKVFGWGLLLLFAVIFSLGSLTPLYTLFFQSVPGFRLLRVPARMWYFGAVALVMLGAFGVETLLTQRELARRWMARLVIGGVLLGAVSVVGRYLTRRPNELDWLLGLSALAGIVLALVAIALWGRSRLSSSRFAALLILALAFDLLPLAIAFAEPREQAEFFALPHAGQSIIARADVTPFRIYGVRRELENHVLTRYGLEAAEGLNSFQFANYAQLMKLASGCALEGRAAAVPPCASNEISDTAFLNAVPNPMLLGLLNVRYVIAPFEFPDLPDLVLLENADTEWIYENTVVLPRAFAVGQVEILSEESLWSRISDFDPSRTVLVNDMLTDAPQNDFFLPAEELSRAPGVVEVHVNLPADGMLIFSEAWVPGWKAEVNGLPSTVLRADGALVGVLLGKGEQDVRLTFMPDTLIIGLVISGATLLLGSGLFLFGWRRS